MTQFQPVFGKNFRHCDRREHSKGILPNTMDFCVQAPEYSDRKLTYVLQIHSRFNLSKPCLVKAI